MTERLFNVGLVSAMGADVMALTTASIRQSLASRQALRVANANLVAARCAQVAVKERLARARALRAASDLRAKA